MAKAKATRVFRTEYYEPNIGRWIALCESTDLDRAKQAIGTPVIGNPSKRVAEYDKTGVRKIKYSLVGVVEFVA